MADQCRTNSFRPVHSIVGCMHFMRQNGTMSERNSLVLTLMSSNPFWLLKGKQEAQRERKRESRTANPIGAMPEERKNSREGSRESATLVIRSLYLLGYTRGTDVSRGWRNGISQLNWPSFIIDVMVARQRLKLWQKQHPSSSTENERQGL